MLIEFCLPVYNEEKILKENVLKLLAYCEQQNFNFTWVIVIINNGSTDRSKEVAEKLKSEKIRVVNLDKAGKGGAIKHRILLSEADIIAYMDIDLAVSLDNIPDLINSIMAEDYQLVIGSRLLPDSKTERSFARSLSSIIYNMLSRIILKHNFSDLQCGFKAMKTPVFKKITSLIKDDKWFFDTELIVYAVKYGYKIKEIPVNWEENRYDKRASKVRVVRNSFLFFFNLIKLKFRLIFIRI